MTTQVFPDSGIIIVSAYHAARQEEHAMSTDIAAIADLSHPTHACLIYRDLHDRNEVICEFLARGLTRGEKCLFLEAPPHLETMRQALRSAGVNVASEEKRGALILTDNVD